MAILRILFLIGVSAFLFACKGGASGDKPRTPRVTTKLDPKVLRLTEPVLHEKVTFGEDFNLRLEWLDDVGTIDSVELFFDAVKVGVLREGVLTTTVNTGSVYPGSRRLRVVVHLPSEKKEIHTTEVLILSELIPQLFTYKVKNEFPHDIGAFTQGFEYHNNFFYEGTGQYGQSSLRKTEISTGQILKARTLASEFFGEGITILNDKIYQITYRSQVGFVYDLETFGEVQKIYYQNKEGWGLTNNGAEIIMSDGTHQIYFMDPRYFSVNRKIEVMDHKGKVELVNELEWIDGKIWANIYLTDEIIIIDPESGRVEGRVDLKHLLKPADRHRQVDVLNGIAWDAEARRLFVTGKYWPKIFEIEVVKL
jgi:glutaminyl-peptide cyclotransferase